MPGLENSGLAARDGCHENLLTPSCHKNLPEEINQVKIIKLLLQKLHTSNLDHIPTFRSNDCRTHSMSGADGFHPGLTGRGQRKRPRRTALFGRGHDVGRIHPDVLRSLPHPSIRTFMASRMDARPSGPSASAEARRFLEKTVARGDDGAIKLEIGEGPRYRAHYRQDDNPHIQAKTNETPSIMVHEYGHAIDHQVKIGDRSANESSQAFLKHRVGDEVPIDMHERFKAGDPGEMGRKDRFQDAMGSEYNAYYTGKDYGNRPPRSRQWACNTSTKTR